MSWLRVDVRTKLLLLVLINLTATLSKKLEAEVFLLGFIGLYYLVQGEYKFACKGLGIYIFLSGLVFFLSHYQGTLLSLILLTVIVIKKIYPIAFFAASILMTTRFGELLAGLHFFRLPKLFIFMLAIVLRFIPSFYLELKNNRNAFQLRIYEFSSFKDRLTYAINFTLVPLMRRAELVIDELSQTAILRGLDNSCPRTSIFTLSFGLVDGVFLVGFLILFLYARGVIGC